MIKAEKNALKPNRRNVTEEMAKVRLSFFIHILTPSISHPNTLTHSLTQTQLIHALNTSAQFGFSFDYDSTFVNVHLNTLMLFKERKALPNESLQTKRNRNPIESVLKYISHNQQADQWHNVSRLMAHFLTHPHIHTTHATKSKRKVKHLK